MSSRESRAVIHGSAHRRRQSRERPPYMSDLRIVLLGKSVSENSGVGNFILRRAAFDSEAPPDVVERVGGRLKDRHVIIINSPQLLQTNISDHRITQTVRECVNLSDPGPHVIVLILNHEQCSTEDQEFVEKVLHSFSEKVYQHTIVITTQEPTETKEILQKIIQKCAKRHFSLQGSSSPHDLLQTFEDIVQLNDGQHLVCAEHEASQDFTMKQQAIGRLSEGVKLNLVVCGSDRTLKSSVSKRILQQTARRSDVKLHGRQISLVELPALFNTQLSEEEVMRQTLHCVSLCHPGVHVFLLILPDAPLTDEDKAEMEIIQRIFSSKIKKHIMILIINEKNMIGKVNLIHCSSSEMSIQSFGGRRFVLENSSQVPDLLQDVENMVRENQGSYYTTFMYLQARVELERNKHRAEIEELRRSMMKTQSTADVTHDDLRIVLLGKVGVGKSATRNAILRKKAFKSTIKSSLLTRECQKETSEFNRREITVIDTPGLFDTGVDNVKTRKEIVKCISMAAPGPHVFLLVIQLGRFTQEEKDAVKMIQEMFGDQSRMYTMVLFTTGDDLDPQGTTIEEIIEANDNLQYLIMQCGKRYHVFKNNEIEDQTQVSELLDKIDCMVAANGGSFYTSEMIQQVDKNIREEQDRIMKEKEEENKRKEEELRAKYEAEIEQMKKENERERQEMQNELRKKGEEFKKREEEIKKETNENLQKELQRKLEELKQFEEESKRKEKALGEQQQNFIKHMEEKYEKKKQNLHEKIQHDTREQAELKYLTQLEIEVDKALQTYNTENTESLHEQEKQDCDYSFYTSEMFQQEEKTIRERQERIIKEKEEEIKRREEELRAKYEEEIEEVKKENERQRQEMQNELRKIAEEFKKREKEIKKRTDENVRKELQRKPEEEQKLFEEQKENRKKNLIEKHQESILFETRKTSNEEVEKLAKCIQELGNSLDRNCSFASLLEQHRGQRRYRGFIEATAESFVDSFLNIVNWIIGSHSKRETQKQTEV